MASRHDNLAPPMIEASDFSFTYDNSRAVSLDLGDMTIPAGQFVVV